MERVGVLERVVLRVFRRAAAGVPLFQSGRYPGWDELIHTALYSKGKGAEFIRRESGINSQPVAPRNSFVESLRSAISSLRGFIQ